jgi:hypothetical protein
LARVRDGNAQAGENGRTVPERPAALPDKQMHARLPGVARLTENAGSFMLDFP